VSSQIEQVAGIQAEAGTQSAQEKRRRKKRAKPPQEKARPGDAARKGREAALSETQQLVARKRQLREARRRRSSARRLLVFFGAVLLVAALVFGTNFTLHSQLFTVAALQVNATQLLTRSEVTTLAAVPPASSVPLLNTRRIEENLKQSVWIRSAQVKRRLPRTVVLTVVERRPVVYVDDGSGKGKGWLVSADKVWLGAYDARRGAVSRAIAGTEPLLLSSELKAKIIAVTDVETPRFSLAASVKNAGVKNAVEVVTGVSAELRSQIKSVSAPTIAGTTLYLKNGIEVDVGSFEQIADKDIIIRQILKEQAGKVILINVCTVDKPTWRGLNPAE